MTKNTLIYIILAMAISMICFWVVIDQEAKKMDKTCQDNCTEICTDICKHK